jgi:hypothetical protein
VIAEAPGGQRASGPRLERQHRDGGLAIDDRTCRPRSLGDSLDYAIAVEGLCDRALAGSDERDLSWCGGADLEKRAASAVS